MNSEDRMVVWLVALLILPFVVIPICAALTSSTHEPRIITPMSVPPSPVDPDVDDMDR